MRCCLVFLALIFIIAIGDVHGSIVLSHYGAANPDVEGWDAEPGVGTAVTTVGPILNDGGYDAWFVSDNLASAGGSSDGYWGSLTTQQKMVADVQGWSLRSRLRVSNTPDIGLGSVAIYYFDGVKEWILEFGSSATGEQIVTAVNSAGMSGIDFNTGSAGYHLYEMVYDPISGTTDVFVDSIERISNWTGTVNPGRAGQFKFGSASSPDSGQGNYNMVEFSVTPVPIPGAVWLLGSGLVGLIGLKRKFLG